MITFCVESLTDRLEEMKPLFPLHWAELALNKEEIPLDPQYEEYLRRDAEGQAMFIAGRCSGQLIGYFVGFIAPGLHYKTCLTLTMDIYWIHPDHRGKSGGMLLFAAVEQEAKRRGVQRAFMGSKLHKDSGWLFEKLGYEPVETYYSKLIQETKKW